MDVAQRDWGKDRQASRELWDGMAQVNGRLRSSISDRDPSNLGYPEHPSTKAKSELVGPHPNCGAPLEIHAPGPQPDCLFLENLPSQL